MADDQKNTVRRISTRPEDERPRRRIARSAVVNNLELGGPDPTPWRDDDPLGRRSAGSARGGASSTWDDEEQPPKPAGRPAAKAARKEAEGRRAPAREDRGNVRDDRGPRDGRGTRHQDPPQPRSNQPIQLREDFVERPPRGGRHQNGNRNVSTRGHQERFARKEPDMQERESDIGVDMRELEEMTLPELRDLAREHDIPNVSGLKKQELIMRILQSSAEEAGALFGEGTLEILPEGYGFLRRNGYTPTPDDVYVSQSQIKRFGLRTGDYVSGHVRAPKESEKYYGLLRVDAVNGANPDITKTRAQFEKLIPIYPNERLILEMDPRELSSRIIDLISPIGKGQRGLIVSPPKAGKTILLKKIANSITANHPEIVLMALLIDERPEEVTDFERSVHGEVVSSTFDERPEHHIQVAEMLLEKAKRLVEQDRDVVILLDSITRLARAYNLVMPSSGKTLSGGLDPNSLHKPKRFFGAARNLEGGGSLTIVATALVDTGSRLDDVIFEEFKGTGNMELVLNRDLANKRIFPAIDILRSGTRHDELLYTEPQIEAIRDLRRLIDALGEQRGTEFVIDRLANAKVFPTNEKFIEAIPQWYMTFMKDGGGDGSHGGPRIIGGGMQHH